MKKSLLAVVFGLALTALISLNSNTEAYAATSIEYTDYDYAIIPDRYNTGADEYGLEKVTVDDAAELTSRYGLPFKKSSDTRLVINFQNRPSVSGEFYIENVDFSSQSFRIYNAPACNNYVRIVFVNCKFSGFTTSGIKDESANVTFECRNCTFQSLSISNTDLYNCYVAGGQSDGIRAFNNVNVVSCYIADKSLTNDDANAGNHTDGTQIYGTSGSTCGNIHFENCRFELPQMSKSTAYVNACLMLQIEYCDADDITFNNCIINGGGYSIYAWSKNDAYELTNASFSNIQIGCNSRYGNIYPKIGKNVSFYDIDNTGSLYVGSVWEEADGLHLSVTNDTNQVRTLTVYTDNGEQQFTIGACPLHDETTVGMTFADFPFDIDIAVGYAEWAVCYDTTNGGLTQIRYYNSVNENVLLDRAESYVKVSSERQYYTASTETSYDTYDDFGIVDNGTCGDNITWTLEADGTLTLTGAGSMFNYTSSKKAPWNQYISEIKTIIVSEGITKIGEQAFKDCEVLESVSLPSTLVKIGKIAFQKCTMLRYIEIPASVTSIGDRCFASDTFDSVVYLGESWESVEVGTYNGALTEAMAR